MTARIEQTDIGVEDWIDGATFTQVKVEIHRNPAVWAELAPLYDLIDAAQARLDDARGPVSASREPDEESSLGAADRPSDGDAALHEGESWAVQRAQAELDELLEQAEKLYAVYDADKETWTLRALDRDELVVIAERLPLTPPPTPLAPDATPAARARHLTRSRAYAETAAEHKTAVDVEALTLAVVRVDVGGIEMPPPSREGIERLRRRPHGERHFAELIRALESITLQEVVIPAPHRSRA